MTRLKQYSAAIVAAVFAVLAAVAGVLFLTVLKPADQHIATVRPDQPYVMTHEGLFPALNGAVKVTATREDGGDVTIVFGTTGDVRGWIGSSAYTEINGVKEGLKELKVDDHPSTQSGDSKGGQSGDATPSGTQSGDLQSGESQSGEVKTPEKISVEDSLSPAGGDMWLDEATGQGSVSLDVPEGATGRAVLIAADGKDPVDSVALSFSAKPINVGAVASFIGLPLFLVLALVFALIARRQASAAVGASAVTPSYRQNEEPLEENAVVSAEKAEATVSPAPEPPTDAAPLRNSAPHATVPLVAPEELDIAGEQDTVSSSAQPHPRGPASRTPSSKDAFRPGVPYGSQTETTVSGTGEKSPDDEVAVSGTSLPTPTAGPTPSVPLQGISVVDGADEVPHIPTRREIREARKKGQAQVVFEGREFDTGLIPIVSRVEGKGDHAHSRQQHTSSDHTESMKDPDSGESAQTDRSETTDNASQEKGTPEVVDERSIRPGSWTSMVDSFKNNADGEDNGANKS